MADSNIDAYMILTKSGQPVGGESTDKKYGQQGAIQIQSFSLNFSPADSDDDDSDTSSGTSEEVRKAMAKAENTFKFAPSKSAEFWNKQVQELKKALGGKHGKKASKSKRSPCSFSINKYVDTASCQLFTLFCQQSQRSTTDQGLDKADDKALIKSAKIAFRKGGGPITQGVLPEFAVIYFGDLLVTSYSVELDPEEGPKEKVTFSFAQCELNYDTQKATGRMDQNRKMFGWDFKNPADWRHAGAD